MGSKPKGAHMKTQLSKPARGYARYTDEGSVLRMIDMSGGDGWKCGVLGQLRIDYEADYGYDEAGQAKWERSNVVGSSGPAAQIITLAEAFSSAGATTVLASVWSVGDESTREPMVEFYRQLAAGQSKAAALQSAEIKLLRNPRFSRPLYWLHSS